MIKATNTQLGPRGLNSVTGPIMVEPKETVEVKIFEREKEHIEATGWFEIEGDYTADDEKRNEPAQVTVTDGDGKDGVYIPADEFNSMRAAFEKQASDLTTLKSENDDLRKQLADHEDELTRLRAGSAGAGDQAAYTVKETSPGWFGIFGADGKQIGKNMRESDAEAFKAMSPEDQNEYLAD